MTKSLREQALAWGLLSPALVVLGVFGIFPIGYAFFVSLHRWRIRREAFVGLSHYERALGDLGLVVALAAGLALLAALRSQRHRWVGPERAAARWAGRGATLAAGVLVAWAALGLLAA
ncbi:MAG: hypothetical protein ABIL09_13885, partial [Gemmatimonadota bacterium]